MRKESDQAARALSEQSRAMKDVLGGTQNISKQLDLMSGSNKQHTATAARTLSRLKEVRAAIEDHARSAKDTQGGTSDLVRHVEAIAGALGRRGKNGSNSRA
jgi:methyl-accepting chemotaxis protein